MLACHPRVRHINNVNNRWLFHLFCGDLKKKKWKKRKIKYRAKIILWSWRAKKVIMSFVLMEIVEGVKLMDQMQAKWKSEKENKGVKKWEFHYSKGVETGLNLKLNSPKFLGFRSRNTERGKFAEKSNQLQWCARSVSFSYSAINFN